MRSHRRTQVGPSMNPSEPQELAKELDTPRQPPPRRWRVILLAIGRLATWAVLTPPRRGFQAWSRLRPPQQLVLGFASYAIIGTALLCLPISQQRPGAFIDHLFNVTSAISTTGLTTISVGDSYSLLGELVILALFQLGGIGYMTLSSLVMLARGKAISDTRLGILRAGFAVPHYFVLPRFIVHVVVFAFIVEVVGAIILWWRFSSLDVPQPLWSAVFHSVSAFATAGFSLNNNSLEAFAGDWIVNLTIGVLCYLGAIGFIVVQDVWYSIKWREHVITFTSKVILSMTALVFIIGVILFFFIEPSVRTQPLGSRLALSAFQVMTASTTAGFNTLPIPQLSHATLLLITFAMLIGASPSGTGGGIKTTSVSALLAILMGVLRGRDRVVWLSHEIPMIRVLQAVAAATIYLGLFALGTFALCLSEQKEFLPITFEAASAIGTVGLSMGITGDLTIAGKLTIILLMFAGRCGPLTLGLALLRPDQPGNVVRSDDLAV
jgi:trk system potassium uptake protein TrkH